MRVATLYSGMTAFDDGSAGPTRRRYLAGLAGGTVLLAGCTGSGDDEDEWPDPPDEETPTEELLPDNNQWPLDRTNEQAAGAIGANDGIQGWWDGPDGESYSMEIMRFSDESSSEETAEQYIEEFDWFLSLSHGVFSFAVNGPDGVHARELLAASPALNEAIVADKTPEADGFPSDGDEQDGTSDEETETRAVPTRGDPTAPVTLEVYEDFTCPACRTYNEEVRPTLATEYLDPGTIRYEHRDFPFRNESAREAANGAREVFESAGNEAFWTFKATLFDRQQDIEGNAPTVFREIAAEMDLDAAAIETAAAEQTHADAVEADETRGDAAGVAGTPGFVVDGDLVSPDGVDDWEEYRDRITGALEDALAAAGN